MSESLQTGVKGLAGLAVSAGSFATIIPASLGTLDGVSRVAEGGMEADGWKLAAGAFGIATTFTPVVVDAAGKKCGIKIDQILISEFVRQLEWLAPSIKGWLTDEHNEKDGAILSAFKSFSDVSIAVTMLSRGQSVRKVVGVQSTARSVIDTGKELYDAPETLANARDRINKDSAEREDDLDRAAIAQATALAQYGSDKFNRMKHMLDVQGDRILKDFQKLQAETARVIGISAQSIGKNQVKIRKAVEFTPLIISGFPKVANKALKIFR